MEKVELSKEQIEMFVQEMNEGIDNTPLAYLLGREFCGVLFFLLVGSVRSKVFRKLLETVIQLCDESKPEEGFSEFLSRCLSTSTSDVFSEFELDNYFHARIPKDLEFDKLED